MFGKFPVNSSKRIQAYLDEPSFDRWDDISEIIICGFTSVWQALLEYDPTFPRSGRTTDITGKVVKEWERMPAPFTVLKAIKEKLKQKSVH